MSSLQESCRPGLAPGQGMQRNRLRLLSSPRGRQPTVKVQLVKGPPSGGGVAVAVALVPVVRTTVTLVGGLRQEGEGRAGASGAGMTTLCARSGDSATAGQTRKTNSPSGTTNAAVHEVWFWQSGAWHTAESCKCVALTQEAEAEGRAREEVARATAGRGRAVATEPPVPA